MINELEEGRGVVGDDVWRFALWAGEAVFEWMVAFLLFDPAKEAGLVGDKSAVAGMDEASFSCPGY